jgi:tyrosine-specific transport protein
MRSKLLPGSTLGGILLVAGSCIGAGMLGLPILTGLSGFVPSLAMILLAWFFMTATALLLIEINGWFYKRVNIISMAEESLGLAGKIISWVLYLFLFYSLLLAYTVASGSIVSSFFSEVFSLNVPQYISSLFFVIIFGFFIYFGTKPVDFLNRALMFGLILSYLGMLLVGMGKVKLDLLANFRPKYTFFSLPVLITSFGFHNMIPSLTAYMKGDLRRVRITIIGGGLLALCVYLFWEVLTLGIIPFEGSKGIFESYKHGIEGAQVLRYYLTSNAVKTFVEFFAFFAIITSFLAQGLGLTHFIADGFKIPQPDKKLWLCFVALFPPFLFAYLYPQIFFKALGFAGGICAVILFGILPVTMAWIGRYKKKLTSSYHLKGGKSFLLLIGFIALFILIGKLFNFFQ